MDSRHLDYLSYGYAEVPDPKVFAVIDPNWGDPQPILETISDTQNGARDLAANLKELSPYSGAEFYVSGNKSGSWKKLESHGFSVSEIEIKIIK